MDIEANYDKIFRYCYYRVSNKALAEDLTQETFLRFFAGHYREQGKGIRYLYLIARNLCIDESRKRKTEAIPEDISDEGKEADSVIERIHIFNVLMKLPEDDRDLMVMRYMNGESVTDICRITGLSRFALYRRLKRAKERFRELMEGEKDFG